MSALSGRVALVTGAARHLGRGIALGLAERGCDVAVNYRTSEDAAGEVAAQIRALGRRALAVRADVTDVEQVRELLARVAQGLGGPDIVVNNVGDYARGRATETTPELWRTMFESNVHAAFLVSREAAPGMAARGWGRIIQMGFAGASLLRARPALAAYNAAKAALVSLTRSLALELAGSGVTVNAVNLGYFEHEDTTPADRAVAARIPARRLGTLADLVGLVAFLAGDEAAYLTGNALELSGGFGL